MKLKPFLFAALTILYSYHPHKQQIVQASTIDSTLQIQVDSILQNKFMSKY